MFSKIENALPFSKIGNLPEHPQYKLYLLCISEFFGGGEQLYNIKIKKMFPGIVDWDDFKMLLGYYIFHNSHPPNLEKTKTKTKTHLCFVASIYMHPG